MAVLASTLFGAGAAMQKHGMAAKFPKITWSQLGGQFPSIIKTLVANKLWVGGIFVGIAGGLVMTQALSTGDITVIQPLINLTVVVVVLIGVFFLGESLSASEWAGVAVLLVGAVLVSLSGGELTSKTPSGSALRIFFLVVGALAFFCLVVPNILPKAKPDVMLALAAGVSFGLNNLALKQITIIVQGQLGVFDITSIDAWKIAVVTWPALVIAAGNVVGFIAMQMSFSHGRVSLTTPIVTVISVIVPIIAGVTVFQEQVGILRWAGIIIAVAGAALLSTRNR